MIFIHCIKWLYVISALFAFTQYIMQLKRPRRQDVVYQLHFGVLKRTFSDYSICIAIFCAMLFCAMCYVKFCAMLFCCLNLTFDGCSFICRKIRQNMSVRMKENLINVFHGTDLFLYLLKTSENCSFSDVFRGYRKRSVPSNGSIWIIRSVAVLSTTLVWKSVVKTLKLWKFMCSLYSVLFNLGRNELFFRQTSWVKLVVRDKRFRSKRHNNNM